jgi:hypothetical protein
LPPSRLGMHMLLCYMDESGDPGTHPGSPTPTYTVAAVLVRDRDWLTAFDQLIGLRRWVRANFGVRMREEIKASDLVKGSGPWARLGYGDDVRKRLFRTFMRFQHKGGLLRTFAVVIDKSKCGTTAEVRELAWKTAFERLERYANAEGETVLLIPDVGEYEYRRALARRVRRYSRVGSVTGVGSLSRPFTQLIDDPVQRKSHESYFIQLADFNAYAAFRRVVPVAGFKQDTWDELGASRVLAVNKNRPKGRPDGIVLRP